MNLSSKIFNSNFADDDKKKINMSKLAKLMGVSVAGVSLNINGHRRWSADAFIKAMIATGMAYVSKDGKYIMLQTDLDKKELEELEKFSKDLCLNTEEAG